MEKHFTAFEGDLYDTRRAEWASNPVRTNYKRHRMQIETVSDLKATLRAGEHTFPGGYRLAFITTDGAVLSFDAVRDNLYSCIDSIATDCSDGWKVCGLFTVDHCEDPVYCDSTGIDLNAEDAPHTVYSHASGAIQARCKDWTASEPDSTGAMQRLRNANPYGETTEETI
jgi:hypothetical protein